MPEYTCATCGVVCTVGPVEWYGDTVTGVTCETHGVLLLIDYRDPTFCDDCGVQLTDQTGEYSISELKVNVASANKGESAIICGECYVNYEGRIAEGFKD